MAGDSPEAEAIKVAARAHQTLIWERSRHLLRMRAALREYFPPRWRPSRPGADTSSCCHGTGTGVGRRLTTSQITAALNGPAAAASRQGRRHPIRSCTIFRVSGERGSREMRNTWVRSMRTAWGYAVLSAWS